MRNQSLWVTSSFLVFACLFFSLLTLSMTKSILAVRWVRISLLFPSSSSDFPSCLSRQSTLLLLWCPPIFASLFYVSKKERPFGFFFSAQKQRNERTPSFISPSSSCPLERTKIEAEFSSHAHSRALSQIFSEWMANLRFFIFYFFKVPSQTRSLLMHNIEQTLLLSPRDLDQNWVPFPPSSLLLSPSLLFLPPLNGRSACFSFPRKRSSRARLVKGREKGGCAGSLLLLFSDFFRGK